MLIKYSYNHLHAEEFLRYKMRKLIKGVEECIKSVDANAYLKISCDKARFGTILYDQKALNKEIKDRLTGTGWTEFKRFYYVTSDYDVTKTIVKLTDSEEQKRIIEDNKLTALQSFNQVDFVKKRVAIEVQFGKYFSVAYDLHVKHTLFFMRDEIDVGIEIIPTHEMMSHMDTGVAWYENEITNVIREGRNNPTVPVLIWGIESERPISSDPCDYSDEELHVIIGNSNERRLKDSMKSIEVVDRVKWDKEKEKAKVRMEAISTELARIKAEIDNNPHNDSARDEGAIAKLDREKNKLEIELIAAKNLYNVALNTPPERLKRIERLKKIM